MKFSTQATRIAFTLVALLAFTFLGVPSHCDAFQTDAVSAKLKWNVGDEFGITLEQDTVIVTKVDRRNRQVDNLAILELAWTVEKVGDDGTATVKQSIKRLRLRTGPPGISTAETVDFDTALDESVRGLSKNLKKQITPLINVEFSSKISNRGEIVSVDYSEDMMKLLREIPVSMQVRQMFTEEGLQDLFGATLFALPENKVSKDDSWTVEETIQSPIGSMLKTSEHRLASVEGAKAIFTTQTSGAISNAPEQQTDSSKQPSAIELKDFSSQGELTLNYELGQITQSNVTSEFKTQAPYRDKMINTHITTTTRLTVDKTNK